MAPEKYHKILVFETKLVCKFYRYLRVKAHLFLIFKTTLTISTLTHLLYKTSILLINMLTF